MEGEELARLAHLNLMEFSRETARWSGPRGEIEERDGVLLYMTGTTFPFLSNGVLRMDDRLPGDEVIARADEWFHERGRGYTVRARDGDDDLALAADAAGLKATGEGPEMVCGRRLEDRPAPPGIELRWVDDASGVGDFVEVNEAAFSTYGKPPGVVRDTIVDAHRFLAPHVHTVVAYEGSRPVGAGQMLLSHGIAGVYWIGTVEAARGRGIGAAVTRAVTNRAFDAGASVNTLQASPMGAPIYLRMGYETIFRHRAFVRLTAP